MTLSNELISIEIASHGAELQKIENRRTGEQYLWCGDSRFWGRRSPVLFPIVGAVWNGEFRMDGKVYPMSQHGFARDMDFEEMPVEEDDEVWYALESTPETLAKYPRKFRLEIGYRLQGERITVMWRVKNLDQKEMNFQIGAHPAFNYPEFSASDPVHAYFQIDGQNLQTEIISEKGCIGEEKGTIDTDAHGMLPVTSETFARDALIIGEGKVRRVSLLTKDRTPYLTFLFSAPAVGLWSPKADAPFVCIEPWWGRADRVGFEGDFSEREYINTIKPGETFRAQYMIIIDNV